MKKLTWVFQILLVLAFGMFGVQKMFVPIADLIAFGMLWVGDFSAFQVRAIGTLEALGAVGLLAPYFVKSVPKVIVPLAAGGLALTMIGAIATHVFRGDPVLSIVITTALFAMGVHVARARFAELRRGL